MKLIQVGIGEKKITEFLSKLGVLCAVCDTDSKSKEIARKYSAKFYESLDKLIESEHFEGAIVNVREEEIIQVVKKLLHLKKYVFLDKLIHEPSGLSELEKISKKNNVKIAFRFDHRFNPMIENLREVLVEKKYGDLAMLEFYCGNPFPNDQVMKLDRIINEIDCANFIFKELPIVVFARMYNSNDVVEGIASIMIGYRENRTALIILNGLSKDSTYTLRAICSMGVIDLDLISHEIKFSGCSKNIPKTDSILLQMQNFIDLIEEKNNKDENYHELSNIIKITKAALLSSKQGVPIYLDLK